MKILARNKRAHYDYDIVDTMVAGLVLQGTEVKSIKQGAVSLKGAYVRFVNGQPTLTGAHVSPYAPAHVQHDPERDRTLLLHKHEVRRLFAARQNGQHVVPLALGVTRDLVKLEIGIGTSRRKHDKRERIKQRDSKRQIQRALKK